MPTKINPLDIEDETETVSRRPPRPHHLPPLAAPEDQKNPSEGEKQEQPKPLEEPKKPQEKEQQKQSDVEDDPNNPEGIHAEGLKPEQVRKLLKDMTKRFRTKRKIYNYTHLFYAYIDRYLFYLPLLIMQGAVAVGSAILNQTDPFLHYLSGIVSSASAVMLAVQNSFKFTQIAEKYDNAASLYAMLATETFYEMSEGTPDKKGPKLALFFQRISDVEKRTLDVCPMPPDWIVRKFEREQEEEDEEAEKELLQEQLQAK